MLVSDTTALIVPIMNLPFSEKYLPVSDNENTSDGFKNLAICPSASLSRTNIGVGVFPSTLESDRSSKRLHVVDHDSINFQHMRLIDKRLILNGT